MLSHYIFVHFIPMWLATTGAIICIKFTSQTINLNKWLRGISDLALALAVIGLSYMCARSFTTPDVTVFEMVVATLAFTISSSTAGSKFYLPYVINSLIAILCIIIFDVM